MSERSFTIDAVYRAGRKQRPEGGRYISDTPASAAKKMFSTVYKEIKPKGRISLQIHVRETTQGSAHKIYKYKVAKVKQRTEVVVNGQTIIYNYTTKVKAI
jgi:hypothetical protein